MLNVGSFIIGRMRWPTPETYSDIGVILGRYGALCSSLSERLSALAGLRNILVHDYARINHKLLYSFLDRLGEMEKLMNALLDFIREKRLDP